MDNQLNIEDFSGGMTDYYIGCPINKYSHADNMVLRPDGKLETRAGFSIFHNTYYQVPYVSSMKRVDSIDKLKDSYLFQSMGKLFYINSGWVEIQGPGSTSLFSNLVSQGNQNSYSKWNNHLIVSNDYRVKPSIIYNDLGTIKLRQLGLPKVTDVQVNAISFSGAGGPESRNYAFVRSYTYTIDGVEFTVRSAVSLMKNYAFAVPNSITSLPVLTNSANEHYDTANIKLEIYRTKNNGNTFYKVGEVTNGTTSFNDAITDDNLGELLYIEYGDLDYDTPPECKYVLTHGGKTFYLNIKDSLGGIYPNRIVQSNPDNPHHVPESNQVDVDGNITGGGVTASVACAFTQDKTYRLQGGFDSTGNGNLEAIAISQTVGCVSYKSIVNVSGNLFWAAKDGFYYSNGYQVQKISDSIPKTYAHLVKTESQAKKIYGTYDKANNRILWAVTANSDHVENNQIFVAYLYRGVSIDTPFTRWTGSYWPDKLRPTSLYFDESNDLLLIGDKEGYVLKQLSTTYDDIKIDSTTTPNNWSILPVCYDYVSGVWNMGSSTVRKWVTKLIVYAENISKVSIMPWSSNDNTGLFLEMSEIRSQAPVAWGDPVEWRDRSVRWKFRPIINGIRRFVQGSIRCSYKQIRLTNSYTEIESSLKVGQAYFDSVSKTVTLISPVRKWDIFSVDYFISCSGNSYQNEYKIINRTDYVLTVDDSNNTLPNGNFDWVVKGYRKNESVRLLSYSILYKFITPSQSPFRKSE